MRFFGRGLSAVVITLTALAGLPLLSGTAHADAASDEAGFVAHINATRAARGLPALAVDSRLTSLARSWSSTMAGQDRLHHNPNLTSQAPTTWQKLGENVGLGGNVDSIANAFVNSPDHYRNIVDGAFNSVGIGVVWSGGRLWVTEVFMQGPVVLAAAARPTGPGWYRLATAAGEVHSFGSAAALPFAGVSSPVTSVASTPSGGGYWLASANGAVSAAGDAGFYGSMAGHGLNSPVVGIAGTRTGKGYWLLGRDGGIFSFGDAQFFGSTGGMRLNQPVVGMAATPSGKGYWFVASDGGVFSFGDARFFGSTGGMRLNQPVVGMAPTPSGNGYWLVARDGGIFAFGDAGFYGSTGAMRLNQPVVGMAATATGKGYRFVAADGGVFSFGDASFLGSTGGLPLAQPVVGLVAGG